MPNIHRICLAFSACVCLAGCSKETITGDQNGNSPPSVQFESTGEEFLTSALDEVESIADYASRAPAMHPAAAGQSRSSRMIVSSTAVDTVYVYGDVTPEGYGAVVTERHAYPKGLLLITVRKSYGKQPTRIVTETKRYISYRDFLNDSAQQSNVTELYGLSLDTLVTHVSRNGTTETYTFRLPVTTRVTNPSDGSVRVTSRVGLDGKVRSEVRDGAGSLIQIRETSGDSTGALTTYTQFADSSWRSVRSVGLADGSVVRSITSGSK
jgi:hypothetical protein